MSSENGGLSLTKSFNEDTKPLPESRRPLPEDIKPQNVGVSESLCFGSLVMFWSGVVFFIERMRSIKKSRPELDRKLVGCGFPV